MKNILFKFLIIFRRRLFRIFRLFDSKVFRAKPKLIVLCYHNISSRGRLFDISLKDLQTQVDYLMTRFQPISLSDIYEYIYNNKPIVKPSFAVTFDDGYANTLKSIDLFKVRNIRPAIFISSLPESSRYIEKKYLSIDEIMKLRALGWEIGCHGATHKDLTKLSSEELNREIIGAKKKLEEELNQGIRYFAYPYGRYNKKVIEIIEQANFKLAFAMGERDIESGDNPLTLSRIGVDENFSLKDFKAIISPTVIKFRRITQLIGFGAINNYFSRKYRAINICLCGGHASDNNSKNNKFNFNYIFIYFKKIIEYFLSGYKKGLKFANKTYSYILNQPLTRQFQKYFRLKKILLSGIFFIIVVSIVLGLTIRGLPGNPNSIEINNDTWVKDGPFELSPERGRYALLYSIVENKSLNFTQPLASFAMPDLGLSPDGKFVSLFAPGVSFIAIPGYWLGRLFGIAQVGSYSIIALFALFNALLIRLISLKLGAEPAAANLGGLVYLFATPAFAYAVSFYQHQISVFILLSCIYLLIRWDNWLSLSAAWLLLSSSIIVDNPNFFLLFPLGVYTLLKIFRLKKYSRSISVNLWPAGLATCAVVILPIIMLLWFNQASHGDSTRLSGTLPAAKEISQEGEPLFSSIDNHSSTNEGDLLHQKKNKSALGFFQTRNLLNGFYIHFLSPDRGIIRYTPVILLGILGVIMLYKGNTRIANLFIGIIGINVLVYSMWGDPYGGWAFGSRYLIPGYALLGIGLAVALTRWQRKIFFVLIFICLFGYSVWVNTLGAITSSSNPPQIEVLALEQISGKEEKYTYARNQQFLEEEGSKSFAWQAVGRKYITAEYYHRLLTIFIFFVGLGWLLYFRKNYFLKFKKITGSVNTKL